MAMNDKLITLFKDSDLNNFETIRQVYPDNWESITGILIMAIIDYSKYGKIPDFSGIDTKYSGVLILAFNQTRANLDRGKEISEKRAESGKRGGTAKAENLKKKTADNSGDDKQTVANASNSKQTVPNDSKEYQTVAIRKEENRKEEKTKESKRNIFIPPTVEEVKAYCNEKGSSIDPEQFIDYYTARGWMLNKNQKMKDWKAAVRTWERNDYGSSQKTERKYNDNAPGQRATYSDDISNW